MAAVEVRKNVLILGHSYVRRLAQFVYTSSMDVSPNFGINIAKCKVFYARFGGASVHRIHQELRKEVNRVQPSVVILQVGSNDVKRNSDDPEELATRVLQLARRLVNDFGIAHVVVSQLFLRNKTYCTRYNEIVQMMNTHLHDQLQGERCISFWRHFGFWNAEVRELLQHKDKIHFNDLGN